MGALQEAVTPPAHRKQQYRRRAGQALGGVAAQGSQALASFALQILAARLLGLDGLGRFAALYAFIILAAALVSGFVGDSLTVLDRRNPRIRAGLQSWWVGLSILVGAAASLTAWLTGLVDGRTCWVVGLAATIFVLEDTLRRLLMAGMQFWRIVVVDLTGLGAALLLIVAAWSTLGTPDLFILFSALAVGQAVGLVVAALLLPAAERHLAPWRSADLWAVASYGAWRSLQLAVKPAMLALIRIASIAILSATAAGELEAARIYMSPALIVVGGLSTVLFAAFARQSAPLSTMLHGADRIVVLLVGGAVVVTGAEMLLRPWAAPLLTGGHYDLSSLALYGWAAYAIAVAASAPYSTLAAVRGGQQAVVGLRIAESLVSAGVVVVALLGGVAISWVPWILAAGGLAGGLTLRTLIVARGRTETVAGALDD